MKRYRYGLRTSWRLMPLRIEHRQAVKETSVRFVYVIEHNGVVTYVGQSNRPLSRATAHAKNRRLRRGGSLRVIVVCHDLAYATLIEKRRIAWGFAHGEPLENGRLARQHDWSRYARQAARRKKPPRDFTMDELRAAQAKFDAYLEASRATA